MTLFLVIVIISCIGFASTSQANYYSIGVKTGEVYGWRVTYINSVAMNEAFGYDTWATNQWGTEIGSTVLIKITDVYIPSNPIDNWVIRYEYLKWTHGLFFEYQGECSEWSFGPLDPSRWFDPYCFGSIFCPIPVSEYLKNAFRRWFLVSGNSVSTSYSNYSANTLLTYTNSGVLSSLKYIYNEKIIYEVDLYDVIGELPLTLALIVLIALIALIAVVIICVKKRIIKEPIIVKEKSLFTQKEEVIKESVPTPSKAIETVSKDEFVIKPQELTETKKTSETDEIRLEKTLPMPTKKDYSKPFIVKNINVTPEGEWTIENDQSVYLYKVKVENNSEYMISNVQIMITSTSSGLHLISERLMSFADLDKNSFLNPTFKFAVKKKDIANKIESIVSFKDYKGKTHTILVKPLKTQ